MWLSARPSRLVLVIAFALLVSAYACSVAARASDDEELKKYWRYFEMTVAFTAEGKELEARGILGCKPYFSKRYSGTRVQYDLQVPWIAKRLPSGAGVLFPTPGGLCTRYTYTDKATGADRLADPISPDFLPVTLWLDNADNPQIIEEYASEAYYRAPSSRLRIHRVAVDPVPSGPATNPADEVGWLAADPLRGRFVGFYATLVPKTVWSAAPEVASIIDGLAQDKNLIRKQHAEISKYIQIWAKGGDPYSFAQGVPVEGRRLPRGYTDKALIALSRAHPIVLHDSRYELDARRVGIVIYYPRPARSLKADTAELWSLVFTLEGHRIETPTTYWQYDTVGGNLFEVEPSVLRPCPGCRLIPKRTRSPQAQ